MQVAHVSILRAEQENGKVNGASILGPAARVQPRDMVDKSTDPFQPHFGPVIGEEEACFQFPARNTPVAHLRQEFPLFIQREV